MIKGHNKAGILALILALTLAVTGSFAMPVMAEPENGTPDTTVEEPQKDDKEQNQEQTQEQPQEQTEGNGEEHVKLTPEDLEAEAIAKYGTYTGRNACRIPVITYHRVVTDREKKSAKFRRSSLAISKSDFEKQMKWLYKNGYRTINCEEFYLWHEGKIKLPKKSVLITFDDGHIGVAENALPVLEKYGLKGTSFIIGNSTKKNRKRSIGYKRMLEIMETYPDLEFQSHTYKLHKHYGRKGEYEKVLKDAEKQKSIYGFEYLAYPFGRYTPAMIRAYKRSGIKMAFTYGQNDYATRHQNLYKIRRIKIYGGASMAEFKKWFR